MKSKEILDAEICLLLLKYGEQACIKSLAGHLGRPAELLKLDILKFQSRSTRPSSQKTRQPSAFRIDDLVAQYPAKAEALRKLNSRFESKEFLPELKDVRRFFDRHSGTTGALKSRGAAQAKLFNILAQMSVGELETLCRNRSTTQSQSSLGLISDEILGRPREEK